MSLEWVAIAVLAVVVLWMFYQLSSIKGDARHAKWRAEEVRREGQRSDNDTLRMLRALARQLGYSWVEPNPEPARWRVVGCDTKPADNVGSPHFICTTHKWVYDAPQGPAPPAQPERKSKRKAKS